MNIIHAFSHILGPKETQVFQESKHARVFNKHVQTSIFPWHSLVLHIKTLKQTHKLFKHEEKKERKKKFIESSEKVHNDGGRMQ